MTELPATLVQLQNAIRVGTLSIGEAVAAQKNRVASLDAKYRCVVEAFDDQPASGAGSLAGISLAHKDIFDTPNRAPGVGHDHGRARPGNRAATAISRLHEAGAMNLAALTMAEYACGATGDNPRFDRIVNPLSYEIVVGGSSSGSAVAVACEMAYGSLGTDTAGSVRIPAATCGLIGLKTTHGLVSKQGVFPLAPSLDSVGILTRSANDALAMLDVVADDEKLIDAQGSPRIAAWIPSKGIDSEVGDALTRFSHDTKSSKVESECAEYQALTHLSEIVMHSEAAQIHRESLIDGAASDSVKAVALTGLAIPREWYEAALADRARRTRAFVDAHLRDHDFLILPSVPNALPDWTTVTVGQAGFDVRQLLALHRFMGFVNYLGLPAISMPIASDSRGLPISVQLVARPFHERSLLAFAASFEEKHFGASGFTRNFTNKRIGKIADASIH